MKRLADALSRNPEGLKSWSGSKGNTLPVEHTHQHSQIDIGREHMHSLISGIEARQLGRCVVDAENPLSLWKGEPSWPTPLTWKHSVHFISQGSSRFPISLKLEHANNDDE